MQTHRILTINPEIHATNVCVFDDDVCIFEKSIHHHPSELRQFANFHEQAAFRENEIYDHLDYEGLNVSKLHAVCGRGGLLHPIEGGTYYINEAMIADLEADVFGKHVSNLGGILAFAIGKGLHVPSFVVDPVVVDELEPVARISGFPELPRKSIFHALNQKAVARMAAADRKATYENLNMIVAHMGYGITIGAHRNGKVIDVNNGLNGEGPFSMTRAGTVPIGDLLKWCLEKGYGISEISSKLFSRGGMQAYLQTDDIADAERKIDQGDQLSETVYHGLAYQISKEIGAMGSVLNGQVDVIVLTGMLAYRKKLTELISKSVCWISDTLVYPGDYIMPALAAGALRVLRKQEEAKHYESIE
ncbi:butyrate kinase [Virgibacillus halophilus]|uniref:Probable butyrate kinase n=1 Tax=Tigheibacillus halophilus TaxID=361280 RepID=A0ABU5CCC4_9BACI|nr:butyrate kinase [Virgibacillus halophilus]